MKEFLQYIQNSNPRPILFFFLILCIPTQFGKHFWPDFAYVLGQRIDYLSPTLYFTDILAVFFICLWLLKTRKNFQPSNFKLCKKINIFSCILLFLAIGIFLSRSPLTGWYYLLKFLEYLLLGFAIKDFFISQKNSGIIIYPFILGIFFESVLAIAEFISQASIGGLFYFFGERTFNGDTPGIANASLNGQLIMRPYATFSHPNVLAGYLVIAMTVVLFHLYYEISIKKKIIFISSILFGTTALFLSLSRVAIIIWVIVLIGTVVHHRKKLMTSKIQAISYILLATSLASAVFLLSPLHYRFFSVLNGDESITDRIYLMQAALEMMRTNTLFGIGFGNFLPELPFIKNLNVYHSVNLLQPVHNIFLLIAAETGIPGLLYMLWFLWKTFRQNAHCSMARFYCKSQHSPLNTLLLIIILILGMFDHYFLTSQQGQLLFMLVVAICWAKNGSKMVQ